MITIDGKQLRNLEEQVLKNKQDIARHYQATQLPINLAGITVIGSITDPADLEGKVGEQFGDAYVQVVGEDTKLWIWTRSNPDAGEDTDYWIDIPFTTVGEQGPIGPVGPRGEKGERGSKWYIKSEAPTSAVGYLEGDVVYVPGEGNIYHLHKIGTQLVWVEEGSIIGPWGPQGPRGEQGPQGPVGPQGPRGFQGSVGRSIILAGRVDNIDQLPDPTTQDVNTTYLVGTTTPYTMYVVTGSNINASNRSWTNSGPFNTGTLVEVQGEPVYTFDADIKLDKSTAGYSPTGSSQFFYKYIPVYNASNKQTYWRTAASPNTAGDIPSTWYWENATSYLKESPVIRLDDGNIMLPPADIESAPYYTAVRNDSLKFWAQKVLAPIIVEGKLVLGTPIMTIKGDIDYPNYIDTESPNKVEFSTISDGNCDVHYNRFITSTAYVQQLFEDGGNLYALYDGYGTSNYVTNNAITVSLTKDGITREFPVVYVGAHEANDEIEGIWTFFRITYVDTTTATKYNLMYPFYQDDVENPEESFQWAAEGQADTSYYMYEW